MGIFLSIHLISGRCLSKMAVPKRGDLMIRNLMAQRKKEKVDVPHYDEESEFKHLMWDYEHKQLSEHKKARFDELKSKYGNKQNI